MEKQIGDALSQVFKMSDNMMAGLAAHAMMGCYGDYDGVMAATGMDIQILAVMAGGMFSWNDFDCDDDDDDDEAKAKAKVLKKSVGGRRSMHPADSARRRRSPASPVRGCGRTTLSSAALTRASTLAISSARRPRARCTWRSSRLPPRERWRCTSCTTLRSSTASRAASGCCFSTQSASTRHGM